MANPERGELDVVVNEKTYTLKLSMNAAAVLQGRHKKSVGALLREAIDLDFVSIRAIVWLLLQKFHAAEFKTEDAAGNLIDDAGGVKVFFSTLQKLGDITNDESDPNAMAQGNGTGESSTSVLDGSALPLSSSGTSRLVS